MRALRPASELVLAALAVVVVILLTRGAAGGGAPATAAERVHDPRTCAVCVHPVSHLPRPPIPESELASAAPRATRAWRGRPRR